jgi:1,4-dihydroxy-6-naphthoate synthase
LSNTIQIGFSPCPNDTFIFDALVHKKIDTGDLNFEPVLADVETLNEWAMNQKLAITKLSYGVLPLVLNHYRLLNSGSALGTGVGPLLVKRKEDSELKVEENLVAIPGEHTTAHLLFSLAYPEAKNKIFLRYDDIENFVIEGKGYGVIIHENRFTYQDKGLVKIKDLGDYWEQQTGQPIPLGGIVIDKNIDKSLQRRIDELIKKSIEYSFSNYPTLSQYVKGNAQEMSEDVMRKHINLYVNSYSLNLGDEGRKAVKKLLEVYGDSNNIELNNIDVFI